MGNSRLTILVSVLLVLGAVAVAAWFHQSSVAHEDGEASVAATPDPG